MVHYRAARGFGARIAQAALADGDNVVATGQSATSIAAALSTSASLLVAPLDVTKEAQAKAVVEATIERFGRVDVLVNNAGFGLLGAVEEASAEEVERIYRTNVFGLLSVTRAVLPQMR